MTNLPSTPPLSDPHLPAFEGMLGDGAVGTLATALGLGAVRKARRSHVTWRPGRSAEVRFHALVETHGGLRRLDLVAATGDRIEGVPVPRVHLPHAPGSDGCEEVAVWKVPRDPLLPGLRAALDPEAVRDLLEQAGVLRAPVHLRMRAYRPLRRAVVEARTGDHRLFLKVVPPAEVAALQERHATIASHIAAPASHGWSAQHGILLLAAVPGHDLRTTIVRGDTLPSPEDLQALLAALPALNDGRRARSGLRTALGHLRMLRALAPEDASLLDALERGLRAVPPSDALVPVHGDFHSGQVLVEDGRITGLLDLDTVGMGEPVGDSATMIAQFATSMALAAPEEQPSLRAYAKRLLRNAEGLHHPDLLGAHVAANVLGLATGPFRVQMDGWQAETRRRLHLAAAWVHRAGIEVSLRSAGMALDENSLMPLSGGSYAAESA
ncbi:MAG: aminoglycoside phosphotransferase family protein [Dehalococcoidia bacterium]|nr:aminoglycoside phosphotransferase family protein [Dehalococcoidia bacterium]